MNKVLLVAMLLSLTACGSFAANWGGDRATGKESAKGICQITDVVAGVYDVFYFTPEELEYFQKVNADHCERWRLVKSGELAKAVK